MRWLLLILCALVIAVVVLKCGDTGIGYGDERFLVVVEASLHEDLGPSLDQYVDDLSLEHVQRSLRWKAILARPK